MALQFLYTFIIMTAYPIITQIWGESSYEPYMDKYTKWNVEIFVGCVVGIALSAIAAVWGL